MYSCGISADIFDKGMDVGGLGNVADDDFLASKGNRACCAYNIFLKVIYIYIIFQAAWAEGENI